MKIIFSGGGTLGPVTPLLAIREAIIKKYPDCQFIWVGTKSGPEKEIVAVAGIKFVTIGAGKWRRYFSLLNILDIAKNFVAGVQAAFFLLKEKPDLLITAGGFVSVPLHLAGAILGIPAWVHQQDVRPGLANKMMFPFAKKITTALKETAALLPAKKTEWIGNPCRDLSPIGTKVQFNIPEGAPVIFALGGGTGSASVNQIVLEALPNWSAQWHVIHLVGKDRPHELAERAAAAFPNYHVFQFFTTEMAAAYAVADVVIARAGFGTLTELAALSKAAIILPLSGTHQEDNAKWFAARAGIIMFEKWTKNGLKLAQLVKELMESPRQRKELGDTLHNLLPVARPEKIVAMVEEILR